VGGIGEQVGELGDQPGVDTGPVVTQDPQGPGAIDHRGRVKLINPRHNLIMVGMG
jgi:hypothetical protein